MVHRFDVSFYLYWLLEDLNNVKGSHGILANETIAAAVVSQLEPL